MSSTDDTGRLTVPRFQDMDWEELECFAQWQWYELAKARRLMEGAMRDAGKSRTEAATLRRLVMDLWSYMGGDYDRCAVATFGDKVERWKNA